MPSRFTRRHAGVLLVTAIAIAAGVASSLHQRREQRIELLDPARVVLLRTPGGYLEVGSLEKVEEFGWSSSWNCGPLADWASCSAPP